MKTCSKCKVAKGESDFYNSVQSWCKECVKALSRKNSKAAFDANPEKKRSANRANYAKSPEKVIKRTTEYGKAHPEVKLAAVKKHRRSNPEWAAAMYAARRARKLQAIPKWANQKAIELIYEEAQFATEFFGVPFHVDHIIPLKGVFKGRHVICGLHWELNLQVLEAGPNLRKKNLVWSDGPMFN